VTATVAIASTAVAIAARTTVATAAVAVAASITSRLFCFFLFFLLGRGSSRGALREPAVQRYMCSVGVVESALCGGGDGDDKENDKENDDDDDGNGEEEEAVELNQRRKT